MGAVKVCAGKMRMESRDWMLSHRGRRGHREGWVKGRECTSENTGHRRTAGGLQRIWWEGVNCIVGWVGLWAVIEKDSIGESE